MTVDFTLDEITESLSDLDLAILHLLHAGGNPVGMSYSRKDFFSSGTASSGSETRQTPPPTSLGRTASLPRLRWMVSSPWAL